MRFGWILAALVVALAAPAAASADPASFVDPFVGTDGNGHTFPGAAVPFGMVQFSPDSIGGGPGGYNYSERRLTGFSVTRLSGAGCTNFGDVQLMPVPGTLPPTPSYTAGFSHRSEAAAPGSYGVTLSSGVAVRLTATSRTGLAELRYPGSRGTLLVEPSASANARSSWVRVVGDDAVVGAATSGAFGGACGRLPMTYTLYFALRVDHPFDRHGVWSGKHAGAWLGFDTRTPVHVEIGVSYVSVANALHNVAAEATTWNFETVRERARARWDRLLGRIAVSGAPSTTFYTALYHSLLFPSVFSDANGQYEGEDGHMHVATGYTQYANFSGWDIYRGEMQLVALVAPQQASDMVQSLLADYRDDGRFPQWPVANAETHVMVGDPSDAIVADAYAFGARGFNVNLAVEDLVAGASSPQERPGLAGYQSLGYVPGAAAATLEYGIADFGISQLAAAAGDTADAQTFLTQSGGWQRIFDAATGFVEPRGANGAFGAGGFVEGDAWQYTFMVPQDMGGLLAAIGPSARSRLDAFFARLNAGVDAPHAWLGNEPSLLAPYAYLWLGLPWKSSDVVHRALTTLFADRPNGLPGNDDLGALSSWYVWNAIGLYPAIPGVGGFAVVAPSFPHVALTLSHGARVTISSTGAGRVQSLLLGGKSYGSSWLPLAQLTGGGVLRFRLGPAASAWATTSASFPPSFGSG